MQHKYCGLATIEILGRSRACRVRKCDLRRRADGVGEMLIYVTDRPRMRAHVSAKSAEWSRSKYSGRSQLLNSSSVLYGRRSVTSLQIDCV